MGGACETKFDTIQEVIFLKTGIFLRTVLLVIGHPRPACTLAQRKNALDCNAP